MLPMPEPRTRQREAADLTRLRLVDSARLNFTAYGYRGATLRQIASGAEVTTGAFFSHFPSKAAIYREVFGHQPMTADQGRRMLTSLLWAMNVIDAADRVFAAFPTLAIAGSDRSKYVAGRTEANAAIREVGEAIMTGEAND